MMRAPARFWGRGLFVFERTVDRLAPDTNQSGNLLDAVTSAKQLPDPVMVPHAFGMTALALLSASWEATAFSTAS